MGDRNFRKGIEMNHIKFYPTPILEQMIILAELKKDFAGVQELFKSGKRFGV